MNDRVTKAEQSVQRARSRLDAALLNGDEIEIERAKRKHEAAVGRLTNARTFAARLARLAPLKESLGRAADRVIAAAPAVLQRWKDERKAEPARLKKAVKRIVKRTTKDLGKTPTPWRYRGRAAPVTIPLGETFPTGPIIPYVPEPVADVAPRDGLLPGEYVEAGRAQRIVAGLIEIFSRAAAPTVWTPALVGNRMVEAHSVLRRLPMTTHPKGYGTMMPDYIAEAGDLVHQVGSGEIDRGRNRVIRGTGAEEVARMHEALAWPLEYLGNDPDWARDVNEWAAFDHEELGPPERALKAIADGLNRRKVQVR